MTEPFVSRAFRGRRQPAATADRLPPGQYETRDFPVLSAGPTPRTSLATWDFMLSSAGTPAARWTWDEFQALPHETVKAEDIRSYCSRDWRLIERSKVDFWTERKRSMTPAEILAGYLQRWNAATPSGFVPEGTLVPHFTVAASTPR